ncbi:uncharacterized protein K444DRAFT_634707 [Hyaloscypha bicolor E]|uniref:Uncharacterized protein n=1 Tax=Hyaloscypha bicolor E TaxID=1095630 RepID=A0A2J6SSY8_9HELO|nr:uncharacterized protein K444DRAFT_634707 [Hyaloscypha bicolor E]PMD53895.1 hypothetical protein K444DRAFT_634707 [Hyaloscypha bicolor E]
MPSITDKRILTKEWNEEQHCWFLVVDLSISIPKRRELTRYVSETLQQPRLLTFAETCGKGEKAYQYGVSFQPGGGPQRAQLTKTARKEDKINGSEINYRLLDFCNKVASIGLRELASAARRHENLKHASLIPGPKEATFLRTNSKTSPRLVPTLRTRSESSETLILTLAMTLLR